MDVEKPKGLNKHYANISQNMIPLPNVQIPPSSYSNSSPSTLPNTSFPSNNHSSNSNTELQQPSGITPDIYKYPSLDIFSLLQGSKSDDFSFALTASPDPHDTRLLDVSSFRFSGSVDEMVPMVRGRVRARGGVSIVK